MSSLNAVWIVHVWIYVSHVYLSVNWQRQIWNKKEREKNQIMEIAVFHFSIVRLLRVWTRTVAWNVKDDYVKSSYLRISRLEFMYWVHCTLIDYILFLDEYSKINFRLKQRQKRDPKITQFSRNHTKFKID